MSLIQKTDKRIAQSAYGATALLLGLPFVGAGGYFALAGFAVIPLPGKAHAPLWVIGMVGIVFALAGLIVQVAGARGLLRKHRLRRLAATRPGEPWWGDHPWDPRGDTDSPWGRVFAVAGAFVFLVIFLVPFNWWAYASGEGPLPVQLGVGFFDLLAVWPAVLTVRRSIEVVRYGRTQLAYRQFPFFAGERIAVALSPNRFARQQVTLRYVEERYVTRGTGKHRRTTHEAEELWAETRELSAPRGAPEVLIELDLPDDPSRVTRMTANPAIRYWELVLEADVPGVDFRTTFALPVYARPPGYRAAPAGSAALSPLRPAGSGRPVIAGALALVLVAALGFGVAASPLPRIAQAWLAIERLPDLNPSGMAVVPADDGSVWVLTKYDLVRYPGANPDAALHLVGQGAPVRTRASFAAMLPEDGGVWLGGWFGELWRLRGEVLEPVSGREDGPAGRIHALARFDGDLYVGADRLWRLAAGAAGPTPVTELPDAKVRALFVDGGEVLYAGSERSLWRLDREGWQPIWSAPAPIRVVAALSDTPGGDLLVGTEAGAVLLESPSWTARPLLASAKVRSIAVDEWGIWVGVWRDGLLEAGYGVLDGSGPGWRRLEPSGGLPDGDVTGLVLDGKGGVWLSLYGAGAVRADAAALRDALGDAPGDTLAGP